MCDVKGRDRLVTWYEFPNRWVQEKKCEGVKVYVNLARDQKGRRLYVSFCTLVNITNLVQTLFKSVV